jgi:proline iminopeptidase
MKGERELLGDLYPPIEPHRHGWLGVGGAHRLYWEESGNPQGVPALFLHGGPGAGCAPVHRRFFDPRHYRIVLFDQRGSGRSAPYADITDNTTADLVADIESLRRHLGVERWLVFGGSWGSTLALAYGQTHPERCLGFILRGVFLFRPQEVAWFLSGMGTIFPEAERAFRQFLPETERADPLAAYHRRLTDPDPAIHLPAAQSWCAYEEACSRLIAEPGDGRRGPASLSMARIEAHYMVNDGFLAENQLLRDLPRLHGLPATIVQGRYDIVCPIASADTLIRTWPGATYQIVPDGGHSAMEPGIRSALVEAANRFRSLS